MNTISNTFLTVVDRFANQAGPINSIVNKIADFLPQSPAKAICQGESQPWVGMYVYITGTECRENCGHLYLGNGQYLCRYTERVWYTVVYNNGEVEQLECDDPCYHGCGSQTTVTDPSLCPSWWPD